MKLQVPCSFILFILIGAACSGNLPAAPRPFGWPPAPFAGPASPARIDAPPVEMPAILQLQMFDALNGWALTESEIVRTNDGGMHWYDFTPPEMDETGYSVDTFFGDNDYAWVQSPDLANFPESGTLFRTGDGGRTWKNFSVPFSRGDLHFLDTQNGWMLADLGVGAGSNVVAVFQTTDGGASWERKYSNETVPANEAGSLPLGALKSDLVPLDVQTAWVTGAVYAPGEVYLYRTDDGGQRWEPAGIPLPPGAENAELGIDREQMKFVSARDGFLVLRMSGDATIRTMVYVTQDAGNTWSLTPTILEGAGPSSFISAQEAVLYNGGQFLVTRDAAQTWVLVPPDISFGETFVDMQFVDPMTGWVITMDPSNHRSLYRTQDGGSTWLPVVP